MMLPSTNLTYAEQVEDLPRQCGRTPPSRRVTDAFTRSFTAQEYIREYRTIVSFGLEMTGWAITAVLSIALLLIAVIDFRQYRIPDLLSLPLLVAGLALAWHDGPDALIDRLIGAIVGFGVLAAFGEAYFRLRGVDGLGLGDAKLFGAAGAWLGWQALPLVLLIATVSGLVVAMLSGARGTGGKIAFGPWISLGFLIVWLAGSDRAMIFFLS